MQEVEAFIVSFFGLDLERLVGPQVQTFDLDLRQRVDSQLQTFDLDLEQRVGSQDHRNIPKIMDDAVLFTTR